LQGHTARLHAAQFSPDGRRILSVSRDNTIRLWEADSAKLLRILIGQTSVISSASFSPDGCRIVVTSDDGTVRLWNVAAETRSAALLSTLIGARVPFQLKGNIIVAT
jgi:WD40 repeat protein